MEPGIISLLIIIANVVVSYRGFASKSFFYRYHFEVDRIKLHREYWRLITSGFLHVNWPHLIFNMIALYFFSPVVETFLGTGNFLLLYFASMVGGGLFSLFVHRHQGAYSSVGASGAIAGIMFAVIALAPSAHIGFLFLPISLPAWLYGLLYIIYSIWGVRSRRDNVGHEAHLAGALIGMLLVAIIEPQVLVENYPILLTIFLPGALFIYLIITRPHLLLVDNLFYKSERRRYTIDQRYNAEKRDQQAEVDRILDKIHKRGMGSLTRHEKEMLDRYSKTAR